MKDHEIANKKLIGRLEYQLQMSKIKLSTSRNENTALKGRVVDLRREKILHVQILNDLVFHFCFFLLSLCLTIDSSWIGQRNYQC